MCLEECTCYHLLLVRTQFTVKHIFMKRGIAKCLVTKQGITCMFIVYARTARKW